MQFNNFFHQSGKTGELITKHGIVKTPNFIFCCTNGTVKGLSNIFMPPETQMILCNTFHLFNSKVNESIHKWIGYNGPIISDSGGFQIFSLGYGSLYGEIKSQRKGKKSTNITENGCQFNSDIFLSPETSANCQIKLGVDIAIAFDECTSSYSSYEYTKRSTERSMEWGKRSLDYFYKYKRDYQEMLAVLQGGIYKDLREQCMTSISQQKHFGVAIGGSLGTTKREMINTIKTSRSIIPQNTFVHLLGIGKIWDLWEFGPMIDSFDCVEPTRIARHGTALTSTGKKQLKKSIFSTLFEPICRWCECKVCKTYTCSYINYLIKHGETSGFEAILYHNISFMNKIMTTIRESIENNSYYEQKAYWQNVYKE